MSVMASTTGTVEDVNVEALAVDAQKAIDALGSVEWEVSLLLCDDAFIGPLNGQWRGTKEATDVLSFPQLEIQTPGHPPVNQGTLLGDIVVSVDTADRQASSAGHSLDVELRVLVVHGLCHLVGHTHDVDDAREAMQQLEARLLTAMGLDAPSLIARAD